MPKSTKKKKTLSYSNNFKVTAVQMSLVEGVKVGTVAASLDIHPYMLSRWRKEYREGKIVADKRNKSLDIKRVKSDMDKLSQMEAEIAQLKKENDLLKKWQRFLAEQPDENTRS